MSETGARPHANRRRVRCRHQSRRSTASCLKLITALLGEVNVSHVPLQLLTENRFAIAELFGKLANVCGDLDV